MYQWFEREAQTIGSMEQTISVINIKSKTAKKRKKKKNTAKYRDG